MTGDAIARQEVGDRFGFEDLHGLEPAQQPFAGRRGPARRRAHDQSLPKSVFERLDALRDRRGRQCKTLRSGVEAAFVQHGCEGGQLRMQKIHASTCIRNANQHTDYLVFLIQWKGTRCTPASETPP